VALAQGKQLASPQDPRHCGGEWELAAAQVACAEAVAARAAEQPSQGLLGCRLWTGISFH